MVSVGSLFEVVDYTDDGGETQRAKEATVLSQASQGGGAEWIIPTLTVNTTYIIRGLQREKYYVEADGRPSLFEMCVCVRVCAHHPLVSDAQQVRFCG